MALAETPDVADALGRDLTDAESTQVLTLLDEASDLTVGYLGCDPSNPEAGHLVPGPVTRVVARMVARVFSQAGIVPGSEGTTETIGPFSQTVRFASGTTAGAPWLAATDKLALRPYRCGAMRAVALSTDQTGRYRRYP